MDKHLKEQVESLTAEWATYVQGKLPADVAPEKFIRNWTRQVDEIALLASTERENRSKKVSFPWELVQGMAFNPRSESKRSDAQQVRSLHFLLGHLRLPPEEAVKLKRRLNKTRLGKTQAAKSLIARVAGYTSYPRHP